MIVNIVGKAALTVNGPAPDIGSVRDGLKVIAFEQTPSPTTQPASSQPRSIDPSKVKEPDTKPKKHFPLELRAKTPVSAVQGLTWPQDIGASRLAGR